MDKDRTSIVIMTSHDLKDPFVENIGGASRIAGCYLKGPEDAR